MDFKKLSTKEKALRINLDPKIYGSFAEIGAGQDVAAAFFKAGGASGTIAKTMSAYDMAFSDAIYGQEKNGRYVCEPRLIKMLDKEYSLLKQRLPHRAATSTFFAFANTVEAINFKRTNKGHGWLGVRFQLKPEGQANECIIHVRLKDNDNLLQQQAIGTLGVNLIYGCFYMHEDPEELLLSLLDELGNHRIEIDYFKITGPDFKDVDNRLFSLKLVKNGLADATMFGPDGSVLQPADALYKKNVLVLRGRFRPVTYVNLDMLEKSYEQFLKEPDVKEEEMVVLSELTLNNLSFHDRSGNIDEQDFLDRIDILCSLGQTVLISNYHEHFRLVDYLAQFMRGKKLGVVMGVYNLEAIFEEKYYEKLHGGILEAFGMMFGRNLKVYVYPSYKKGSNTEIIHSDDINIAPHLKQLFQFFRGNNKIVDIEGYNKSTLHIISDNVLEMIKKAQDGWEQYVPPIVAQAIKDGCLFDYPCDIHHKRKVKMFNKAIEITNP
ncbi:MAG: TonB-dependent receptor [Flammeovirgaceae bacterium]